MMPNVAGGLLDRLADSRPAFTVDRKTTSRSEVAARARAVAHDLVAAGVDPGSRVGVLVPAGPELAAAILGVIAAGCAAVLVEPGGPERLFHERIAAADPHVVLVDARLPMAWRIPFLQTVVGDRFPPRPAAPIRSLPRARDATFDPVPRSPNDPAIVLFTSGTTGAPRGIVHSHLSLAGFLDRVGATVQGLDAETYLAETPGQLFYALHLGSHATVISGSGDSRSRRALAVLASGAVRAWFGAPWVLARWLEEGRPIPHGLGTILLGSAPVTRPFLQRLLVAAHPTTSVRCVYGLTECGPVATIDGREKAALDGRGDPVGALLQGVEARIVDDELEVRSAACAPSTLDGPLGDYVRTGDLATLDSARVTLLGRRKDMIVRRGINLYPGLLEPLLDGVAREAALVGVYDPTTADERVVLFVAGPSAALDARVLGLDALPDEVIEVRELPRAGRQNKVDKNALRADAARRLGLERPT